MNTIAQIAHDKGTTESTIVAQALGLKTSTVRSALHKIMQKAGVNDKGALLYWWLSQSPNGE